jgi:hypothetical protein
MKKYILLIIMILTCTKITFAQDEIEIEKAKNELSTLFKKADKNNLQNLLSYKIDDKTGFIDAKTKRAIVKPTVNLSEVTLFNPIIKGVYKAQYNFEIDSRSFQINIDKIEPFNLMTMDGSSEMPKIKEISSKTGYKGFEVDANGKLKSYSDLYKTQLYYPYVRPFKFQGNYYAIVTKQTGENEYYVGIIDTAGNPLPQFNFIHKMLEIDKLASDSIDVWFIANAVRDLKGSFISFKGKVKLQDELVGYYGSDLFGLILNSSDDGEICGILDEKKIEWVIKPQTKFKIIELNYSSKEFLDKNDVNNRSKANIYFKVRDLNKEYYVDLLLNKYIPE